MPKTKKAFTIVELVFVILIIGVLSAVMIPKLMASRDDAKIAVALSDVGRLVSEISIFYTAYGSFDANLSRLTSVKDVNYTSRWDSMTEKGTITYYTPKNRRGVEPCLTVSIQNEDGNMTVDSVDGSHENVCRGLQKIYIYKKLLTTKSLIGNNIF